MFSEAFLKKPIKMWDCLTKDSTRMILLLHATSQNCHQPHGKISSGWTKPLQSLSQLYLPAKVYDQTAQNIHSEL